jgi:biotin operon repressor
MHLFDTFQLPSHSTPESARISPPRGDAADRGGDRFEGKYDGWKFTRGRWQGESRDATASRVLNALRAAEGAPVSEEALAAFIGTTCQSTVAAVVRKLRRLGYPIRTWRGSGYYFAPTGAL